MHMQMIAKLLFFSFLIDVKGDILDPRSFSVENSEEIALQKWKILDMNMRSVLDSVLQQLLPIVMRSASDVELSPECMSSLLSLTIGLRQLKEIPLKMIDASAKIPSGIFSGTGGDYGSYDQCLDLVEIDDFTKETKYQGQYCLVELRPSLPPQRGKLRLSVDEKVFTNFSTDNYVLQMLTEFGQALYFTGPILGVCVPSTCSKKDMNNVVSHLATLTGVRGVVDHCEIKEEQVIDNLQYGLIGALGLVVLLSLLGTVGDVLHNYYNKDTEPEEKKKSILRLFFTSFSIEKNVLQLLKVEEKRSKELQCIHGIRFISMAWVILGHTYILLMPIALKNTVFIKNAMTERSMQTIAGAPIVMETFFYVGGLVMSYSVLNANDSQTKFFKNLGLIIFRRFWRILPAILLLTAVQIILPLTDSGPRWKETQLPYSNRCRKTWYLNTLFVSNFFPEDIMCLAHLWYLSMDMQFFLVAIALMILFFWKKIWSLAICVILIISSIVMTSAVTYWKDFFPVIGIYSPDATEIRSHFKWVYFMPTTHFASYGIGFITGVILAYRKNIRLHPFLVAACWCASTALCLTVIYVPAKWTRGEPISTAELIIFSGLYRTIFTLGVGWVIFACISGYGGVVNRILSWTGFIPLSRLTFLAYVWHPVLIMYWICRAREPVYAEHHVAVMYFFSFMVISYALAFVTNVIFDGPVSNVTKIIVRHLTGEGNSVNSHSKPSEATIIFSNSGSLKHEAINEVTEGSYMKRL